MRWKYIHEGERFGSGRCMWQFTMPRDRGKSQQSSFKLAGDLAEMRTRVLTAACSIGAGCCLIKRFPVVMEPGRWSQCSQYPHHSTVSRAS